MTVATAVPYFLSSALAASLGLLTPLRRRGSPSGSVFQWITVAVAGWFFFFGMMTLSSEPALALLWARLGAVAALLIPVALYQFTAVALGIDHRRRKVLVAFWVFTVVGAILGASTGLIVQTVDRSWRGSYPRAGAAAAFALLGVAAILATTLFEYRREYKTAYLQAQRTRMRAWMITFAIPLLVLIDALPAYGVPIYPPGFAFVLLFLLLAVYVFRKYWLVSITPSFAAREIVETMADGVIVCDAAGRIQVVNQALLALTGYTEEKLTGQFLYMLLDPEATLADSIRLKRVLTGETLPDRETVFRDRRGQPIEVSLSVAPVGDPQTTAGAVVIVRDIRERKDAEEILRLSEERYRHFVERNLAGVFRMTAEGEILEANDACARIFGHTTSAELAGRNAVDYYEDPSSWEEMMQKLRAAGSVSGQELRLRRPDGSSVWVLENVSLIPGHDGKPGVLEGTMIDITDRKVAHQKIEFQAFHDPLTNLPNRKLFIDRVTVAIAQARRWEKPLAVLFVDLDRFKFINDTFGHAAGDRVLVSVADRVRGAIRASDTVARLGGDELAVLIPELRDPSDAGVVAQKILTSLEEPVWIEGRSAHISASLGVALYPIDGDDPESLLKNADGAMYRAKEAGRNNFQLCTKEMKHRAVERIELEQTLRGALVRGELVLYYQPVIDLQSSRICGVEALLRWNHPDRGLLSPDAFIAVAEDTNLIVPIGRWVIRSALEQLKQWHQRGFADLRLALNLSPRQFQQPDLPSMIRQLIEEAGLDPGLIEFEITESTAMINLSQTISVLRQLREHGIKVAMDDFGIGYSSLNYLKRLPIDAVKIDRSFVHDLTRRGGNAAVIDAVIAIARSLKLRVIAEGIETEKQLDELSARGCHEAQGYLFSPPVAAEKIAPLIQSSRRSRKPLRAPKTTSRSERRGRKPPARQPLREKTRR